MKKTIFVGNIYKSNFCGYFKILRKLDIIISKTNDQPYDDYYLIQFLNTGYITEASRSAISNGKVKDRYLPSVANVGYIGNINKITDPNIFQYYKIWNDIINRCYNVSDHDYKYYGALGISVDESWFCFEKFLFDIKNIRGFELKLKYPDIYQLDKDYLQLNIPKSQRVYSKETCIWLSKYDNIIIMNRDNPTSTGYFGVSYMYNSYYARLSNKKIGRYSNIIAAANRFNHEYLKNIGPFNNAYVLNNVPYMTPEEVEKYSIERYAQVKYNNVGSTTIPETGVESK